MNFNGAVWHDSSHGEVVALRLSMALTRKSIYSETVQLWEGTSPASRYLYETRITCWHQLLLDADDHRIGIDQVL